MLVLINPLAEKYLSCHIATTPQATQRLTFPESILMEALSPSSFVRRGQDYFPSVFVRLTKRWPFEVKAFVDVDDPIVS
jgi:hypothetical protein